MTTRTQSAAVIASAIFVSVFAAGIASAGEEIVGSFSGPDAGKRCNQAAKSLPPGVGSCRLKQGDTYTLFADWSKQGTGGTTPSTGSAGS